MGEKDTTSDKVQPLEAYGSGSGPQPSSAAFARRSGRRPRWVLIVAAIAGLCMITAGIAIAVVSPSGGTAFSSSGSNAHQAVAGATSAPHPTAPAPSGHATSQGVQTKPGVASDGAAKTTLRFPKRLARQVSRWEAGPGGKTLAAVTAQMGYALQAGGARLYFQMKHACASLASDIQTAQAGPAIPDAAMQRMYGKALAKLSQAAATCRSAISLAAGDESLETHVHAALLKRSQTELAAGSKFLYQGTAEVRSLGRR